MSKVCIKCGATLEDNAVFCDECGTKQSDLQTSQQISPPTQQQIIYQPNNAPTVLNNLQPINQTQIIPKISGMSIAAFVLGIIAACTFGILFIPNILGLIFSIIALNEKNTKKNLAIAGLALSIISFLTFFVILLMP